MKYDAIGVFNVHRLLPYYRAVCAEVGERFHAPGRSRDPPGCCHVTANVTRSESASAGEPQPPFKAACQCAHSLLGDSALSSDPPPPTLPRDRHKIRFSPLNDHSSDHNTFLASAGPKQYTCNSSVHEEQISTSPPALLDNVSPVIH